MLRQLQGAAAPANPPANASANASVPKICAKDAECTAVSGYEKGCCMCYNPGSVNANVTEVLTKAGFPATAGKSCANSVIKAALDV